MSEKEIIECLKNEYGFTTVLENAFCFTFRKDNLEIDYYKNIKYLTGKRFVEPIRTKKDIEKFMREITL